DIIGTLPPRVQEAVQRAARVSLAGEVLPRCGASSRAGASDGSGSPNLSRSAIRAACHPLIPCTPGPGGVDWEHKYTPGMPAAYGFVVSRGRASIPQADSAPAAIS